ncbi:hypothetical protein F4805DRAFT_459287 [Annulohypoxylon moriforme]|nr:hypothetical protein F4805DRAFT_459287 [Annulohypoxylon moriforme]
MILAFSPMVMARTQAHGPRRLSQNLVTCCLPTFSLFPSSLFHSLPLSSTLFRFLKGRSLDPAELSLIGTGSSSATAQPIPEYPVIAGQYHAVGKHKNPYLFASMAVVGKRSTKIAVVTSRPSAQGFQQDKTR